MVSLSMLSCFVLVIKQQAEGRSKKKLPRNEEESSN